MGDYKITLTGKDKAGNSGSSYFNLAIKSFAQIAKTPEFKKVIEEMEISEEEAEEMLQEGKIIIPEELKEPSKITEAIRKLVNASFDLWWKVVDGGKKVAGVVSLHLGGVYSATSEVSLRFLAYRKQRIEEQKETIAKIYFNLARKAPGVIEDGLLAVAQGTNVVNEKVTDFGRQTKTVISNATTTISHNVGKTAHNTKVKLFAISEILFDKEPTKIVEIKVLEVGETYAVVFWKTNHHTKNNKVNYGENLSYGNQIFAPDREREHIAKIANLKPNTKYYFEVMSQNKNYIYDSFHEFTTVGE